LLLAGVLAVVVWSGIGPKDRLTWWLEVAPTLLGLAALFALRNRFRFTPLLQVFIALHMILLAVGGHYTYAEVPLGDWFRDTFHLGRNHYDRLGHFAQGFVPALIAREIILRAGSSRPADGLRFSRFAWR
jgi:putative membrane protein